MIKAFVFDLDGVITDTAVFHYKAWLKLSEAEFNVTFDKKFNENLKGVSRQESLERILRANKIENNYTNEEKEVLANKKNGYYISLIEDMTKKDLLPGIEELLIYLKAHNIKIALGSASKNGPFILKKLQVEKYFDAIVNPALLRGKPMPDIFLKGAEALHVNAEEAVGVEDSYSGIDSIKSAGMIAIAVGDKEILNKGDYIVASTRDLMEIARTIIK